MIGAWTFAPTRDMMFLATVPSGSPMFSSIDLTDLTTSTSLVDGAWLVSEFVDVDRSHTYALTLAVSNSAHANVSLWPSGGKDWLHVRAGSMRISSGRDRHLA